MNDTREDKAQKRTDWAEDRTIMANERTYSSWMGTGLGAIGVAIGFNAVFGDFEPEWVAKSVATLFIVISILIFWSARRQAIKTFQRLSENAAEATPSRSYTILSGAMTVAACATAAVLWML